MQEPSTGETEIRPSADGFLQHSSRTNETEIKSSADGFPEHLGRARIDLQQKRVSIRGRRGRPASLADTFARQLALATHCTLWGSMHWLR